MSGSSAARSTARRLPARIASQFARAEELDPRVNAFTHLYSAQGEAIRRTGSLAGADSKSVQMQRRNRTRAHRLARWTGSASVSKTCSQRQMRRQPPAHPELCEVSMERGVAVPRKGSEPSADRHLRRVPLSVRCDGCAETPKRRRSPDRQDQHGRVRHGVSLLPSSFDQPKMRCELSVRGHPSQLRQRTFRFRARRQPCRTFWSRCLAVITRRRAESSRREFGRQCGGGGLRSLRCVRFAFRRSPSVVVSHSARSYC